MTNHGAPTALPPFMQKRVDAERAPELVSPVQLSDELGALMLTFADLHEMLGRSLRGGMVTRAEVANAMSQLCLRAGDAHRRLK
jgi:hypothetical protein